MYIGVITREIFNLNFYFVIREKKFTPQIKTLKTKLEINHKMHFEVAIVVIETMHFSLYIKT